MIEQFATSFENRQFYMWLSLSLRSLQITLETRQDLVFFQLLFACVSVRFSRALCSVRREIGTFSVLSFVSSTPSFARRSDDSLPSMRASMAGNAIDPH